jgi:hypothetical protein
VGDGSAWTVDDVVIVVGTDQNLLANGDFAKGLDSWTPYWATADLGSTLDEDQSARMGIAKVGVNAYDIQLFQVVGLTAGKAYTLAFELKSEASSKNFKVVVEHSGEPWTNYVQQSLQFTQGAGTWQKFTLGWTQPTSDTTVKIGFHFGGFDIADAWLDNAVLTSR